MSKEQARFNRVIELANEHFWQTIATEYSEFTTGDLDLSTAIKLDATMCEALTIWLKYNAASIKSKTTEILFHTIEYLYSNNVNLTITANDIEHIVYCINNGIREGDLHTVDTDSNDIYRGWWSISRK